MATRMLLRTEPKASLQFLRNNVLIRSKNNAPTDQTKTIYEALQLLYLNQKPQQAESFFALRDLLGVNQKPLANLVSEQVLAVSNIRYHLDNHGYNANVAVCAQLAGINESQQFEVRGSSGNQIESGDDDDDGEENDDDGEENDDDDDDDEDEDEDEEDDDSDDDSDDNSDDDSDDDDDDDDFESDDDSDDDGN